MEREMIRAMDDDEKKERVIFAERLVKRVPDYPQDIKEAISHFIIVAAKNDYKGNAGKMFVHLFDEEEVDKLSDLDDDMFFRQAKYIEKICRKRCISILVNFYEYLQKEELIQLEILNGNFFRNRYFVKWLSDGYIPCIYSPYGNMPRGDKWMVDTTNSLEKESQIIPFDFSYLKNTDVKLILKKYIWFYPIAFKSKKNFFEHVKKFTMTIDEHLSPKDKVKINAAIVQDYIKQLGSLNAASKSTVLSSARTFVDYGEKNGLLKINSLVRQMLTSTKTHSKGDTRTYSKAQLDSISEWLEKMYDQTKQSSYKIANYILKIQEKSPLRAKSICDLKTNCLKKIDEHGYMLCHSAKTNPNAEADIANDTVKEIINAIKFTDIFRSQLKDNSKLSEYLFLYLDGDTHDIVKMTRTNYSKLIFDAIKSLGLPDFGQTGIRNFFTKALTVQTVQQGKNIADVPYLSLHSMQVHFDSYPHEIDIYKIAEDFYLVSIGDLDLQCEVKKDYNSNGKDKVMNGAGYCSAKSCDNFSLEDCMFCRHFVTTVAHKKDFEMMIDRLDKDAANENIEHEKEFLIVKKRAAVKILCRIVEIEQKGE